MLPLSPASPEAQYAAYRQSLAQRLANQQGQQRRGVATAVPAAGAGIGIPQANVRRTAIPRLTRAGLGPMIAGLGVMGHPAFNEYSQGVGQPISEFFRGIVSNAHDAQGLPIPAYRPAPANTGPAGAPIPAFGDLATMAQGGAGGAAPIGVTPTGTVTSPLGPAAVTAGATTPGQVSLDQIPINQLQSTAPAGSFGVGSAGGFGAPTGTVALGGGMFLDPTTGMIHGSPKFF